MLSTGSSLVTGRCSASFLSIGLWNGGHMSITDILFLIGAAKNGQIVVSLLKESTV